jgi:aldehyde dehydrogenase
MSTLTVNQNLVERPTFKDKYENFIGGKWVAPVKGQYFENTSPVDGKVFTKVARSSKEDVDLALDAAHAAFPAWSKASPAYRSNILMKVAQAIEDNLDYLAAVETIDNGKPIRETKAADLPLCVDHFRYFASVIRADEGSISEHDANTMEFPVAYGNLENCSRACSRKLFSSKTRRADTHLYFGPDGNYR